MRAIGCLTGQKRQQQGAGEAEQSAARYACCRHECPRGPYGTPQACHPNGRCVFRAGPGALLHHEYICCINSRRSSSQSRLTRWPAGLATTSAGLTAAAVGWLGDWLRALPPTHGTNKPTNHLVHLAFLGHSLQYGLEVAVVRARPARRAVWLRLKPITALPRLDVVVHLGVA